jgi:acyl carrier protein
MKTPYQYAEILDTACGIIAEILGCERDEVQPDSTLGDELEADSLSFVEISFALEKRFHIVLPKKSIIEHAVEQTGSEEQFIATDGGLTDIGRFLLEKSFFGFAPGQLHTGMKRYAVLGATTPKNWANSVFQVLGQLPDACPECGHDTATLNPDRTLACGHCGAGLKPRNGDELLSAYVPTLLSEARTLAA